MRYFPLFMKLKKRRVLVVGAGNVAARKIELLLLADASLVVVAPCAIPLIEKYHIAGEIEWVAREFEPGDVDDAWLVISAVDDPVVRDRVLKAAHARNLHVNVVDRTALSDAIVPAIVDRSPVQVAISSGGMAPVYARRLREQLECLLPPLAGAVAAFVERYRQRIRDAITNPVKRRHFHEWLIDGPVGASVAAGRVDEAERHLTDALRNVGRKDFVAGKGLVSLVGAGPGDPELLTLKALRRLQQADVIVHDGLVSAEVIALARRDAERICVAKRANGESANQDAINRLLRENSLRGHNVVRLKGGDPFVFGRGGEELVYLRHWQIPYEVVPGITAAIACAAYSGIPLTLRGQSDAVSLVTGHCAGLRERSDWAELAGGRHTLAMYMSAGKTALIQNELVAHGASPETPIAFVENGTRKDQRVIVGTLGNMTELAKRVALVSPAMLFVGATAASAVSLGWFGDEPIVDDRTSRTPETLTGELRQ